MRSSLIAAVLLSVGLATPCLAEISSGDAGVAAKPALTVVDGSDASVPVGSTIRDGIDGGDGSLADDQPTVASHAPTPLIPVAALK